MKFFKIITKHFIFFVSHIYFVIQKKIQTEASNKTLDQITDNKKLNELVKELRENGYIIIKNFFNKNKIDQIYQQFYKELNTNEENFFAYLKGDKVNLKKLGEQNINYKAKVNYAIYGSENDHHNSFLFDIITKFEIFDSDNTKFLQDILFKYLNYFPKITSGNLRISFSNSEPASDTQLFHRDASGYKFLKCFTYLHDVDFENGPFTYIKSSHRDRFKFIDDLKLRHNDNEIINRYNEESIKYLKANKGDLIIADTSGFHKGTKNAKERVMLTLNFHAHSEVFRNKKIFLEKNTYKTMMKTWGKSYLKYLSPLI